MRAHIRKLIEEAQRPVTPTGLDVPRDPVLRLASETIRLARLAAGAHMILSARMTVTGNDGAATRGIREDST